MPEEDLVELKFRLYDGSDIGPFRYSPASTVAMLKERIVAEWPKDKRIAPKAANDVKLISAGKILENNKTVAQCKMPFGELPKGVITMHAVVQPSLAKAKTGMASLPLSSSVHNIFMSCVGYVHSLFVIYKCTCVCVCTL
ncbi:hypothetical protein Pfo_014469 [Paulownia fortunei]|nr:hypothetical protein Pfo_014469 [Paulownia fortunei]